MSAIVTIGVNTPKRKRSKRRWKISPGAVTMTCAEVGRGEARCEALPSRQSTAGASTASSPVPGWPVSTYPEVNFIHVEVYTGLQDSDFAPDPAHLAPAVTAEYWNLPSEPWVLVVDRNGIVQTRFEGVLDPSELTPHLVS